MPLKVKGELGFWASMLGYAETNKADTFQKIPTVGRLPRAAVLGLVGHVFGAKNAHIDRAAAACIAVGGYQLGQQNFAISGDDDSSSWRNDD
jgi:hypothetical protein